MASLDEFRSVSPNTESKKFEGSPHRLISTVLVACLGAFSFGCTIGYSSPAIPDLEKAGLLDKSSSSWFGSLLTVGAIFGGPAAGWLVDKIGRKKTLMLSSVVFIFGWLSIATGAALERLLFGRVLCGFASGMVTLAAPVYIAEVSTTSLRGMLGSCCQLSITLGIFAIYSAGLVCSWKNMALLAIVPAVLGVILMFKAPETPRWLLMNNQKTAALQSLAALRGQHVDVEEECRDIEEGLDPQNTFSWSEFRKPELSRPLFISAMIMIFQQFSGINAVMFYTVSIFEIAGFSNAQLATVIVGGVQVVATFVACMLMDRAGRRPLLIFAGIVMTITCFMFGWHYYTFNVAGIYIPMYRSALPVICLVLYIIGFSLGWGPVPMLVMSELFPARARGAASAISVLVNWSCAFLVTKEFDVMLDRLGSAGTFWGFGICCLLGVFYVWKNLPETKGKSLEDIELHFLGKSPSLPT